MKYDHSDLGRNKCSQHLNWSVDGPQLKGTSVSFHCSLGYKNIPSAIAFFSKGRSCFCWAWLPVNAIKRVTSPNQLSDLINWQTQEKPNCILTFTRASIKLDCMWAQHMFHKRGILSFQKLYLLQRTEWKEKSLSPVHTGIQMTAFKISKPSLQENRVFTHLYYFYASFPEKKGRKKRGKVSVGNVGKM